MNPPQRIYPNVEAMRQRHLDETDVEKLDRPLMKALLITL
jgi:hypothetical protein